MALAFLGCDAGDLDDDDGYGGGNGGVACGFGEPCDRPPAQSPRRGSGAPRCGFGQPCDAGVDVDEPDTPAPTEPDEPSEVDPLVREAIQLCLDEIARVEPEIVNRCRISEPVADLMDWSIDLYELALQRADVPGRDLPLRIVREPSDFRPAGLQLNVLACELDPLGRAFLNAYALRNVVFALEPLVLALEEGAAFWGLLVEEAGSLEAVDREVLLAGLGQIFHDATIGLEGRTVPRSEKYRLLQEDPFTRDVFVGAFAFVLFHEIGHANLDHAVVNHLVAVGLPEVLAQAGRTISESQARRLRQASLRLKRGTEAQADIYAATLLAELELTSRGPRMLAAGIVAYRLVSGICSTDLPEEELRDCVMGGGTDSDHPPLDERLELVERIIDNGEDLTHLLETGEAMGLAPESD